MKKFYKVEGSPRRACARTTDNHEYHWAIAYMIDGVAASSKAFRADEASANSEAARMNRDRGNHYKVLPVIEITAAEYKALK